MWSLGVTLLELVLACPLWMSYKAKVVIRDKVIYKTGLFGVKGRESGKIYTFFLYGGYHNTGFMVGYW